MAIDGDAVVILRYRALGVQSSPYMGNLEFPYQEPEPWFRLDTSYLGTWTLREYLGVCNCACWAVCSALLEKGAQIGEG